MPGNNQVGELNVKITGDVAPLKTSLKEAETETQRAATNIESSTVQVEGGFKKATGAARLFQKAVGSILGPVGLAITLLTSLSSIVASLAREFDSAEGKAQKFLDSILSVGAGDVELRLKKVNEEIASLNAKIGQLSQSSGDPISDVFKAGQDILIRKQIEELRKYELTLENIRRQREKAEFNAGEGAIRAQREAEEELQRVKDQFLDEESRKRAEMLGRETDLVAARIADETGILELRQKAAFDIVDLERQAAAARTEEEREAAIFRIDAVNRELNARIRAINEENANRIGADKKREDDEDRRNQQRLEKEAEAREKMARDFQRAMQQAADSFGAALQSGVDSSMGRIATSVNQIANRVEQLVRGRMR
jgi:hypothetical protein